MRGRGAFPRQEYSLRLDRLWAIQRGGGKVQSVNRILPTARVEEAGTRKGILFNAAALPYSVSTL